jgi:hypothetical protein
MFLTGATENGRYAPTCADSILVMKVFAVKLFIIKQKA